MKQTFTFHPCPLPCNAGKIPASAPDVSIEAFENGQYQEALCALLDSIDKNLRNRQVPEAPNEFTIHHGPVTIYIRWDGEMLHIHAPFLELPDRNRLPLMRQAAILNFNDLDLARLCLEDNRLHFVYHCPLAFSHPRKVYQILEEICLVGSRYDYEFQKQFHAQRIISPHFIPYSAEDSAYIYDVIQESTRECLDQLRYFETSRKFQEMRHILAITLMKIIYVAHPQGELRHKIKKAIRNLDRDLPLSLIVADGRQTVKELLNAPMREIADSLYHIETFIPEKQYAYTSDIRERYRECHRQATARFEAGEYRQLCLEVMHRFYASYYKYYLPEETDSLLKTALQESSGQSWETTASILLEALELLLENPKKTTQTDPIIAA